MIVPLTLETLSEAIQLKVVCWQEEINGRFVHHQNYDEEYAFWSEWMQSGKKHQDVRTLLGYYVHDELVGTIFASFAEDTYPNAFEVNGLWVKKAYRNQQISLKLIKKVLEIYSALEKTKGIVYCHKYAPSNNYYLKYGGKIIASETQMDGKLIVNIFEFALEDWANRIDHALKR